MEQHLWSTCQQSLYTDKPLSRQALSSIRSLIVNSHTSDSTISSILETLTRSLQLTTNEPLAHHHLLKLLTDLASHRPHLSPQILRSLRRHSDTLVSAESTGFAADSLVAFSLISDLDPNSENSLIDDDRIFASLCFGPSVSVRIWLLRNAKMLGVRTQVMLTVFLGFTKDPYPYVREAALDGLVRLCKYGGVFDDRGVIEGCYYRAIELLGDNEDCVRAAAVRVVSEWGQMLVALNQEKDKRGWSDAVFLQLCSMVRDMSVVVRVEAFSALGKVQIVSEDILLQTLSKKVLAIIKEKKSHNQCITKRFEILASNAAGAFVHGLEDELYEVRRCACHSLCMLSILSAEFAGQSLNLLMDMLNDDSMVVRLEALETLQHMATFDRLKVLEMHMHMFLSALVDNSDQIRSAARKIFKLVKLPNFELFKQCINGLLKNLEIHPQDEADVFSVLFYMGRSHGNFAAHIIKEVSPEIEPVSKGKLGLDSARVAAFLVLSISAPLSRDRNGQNIPPRYSSYAVTLLGRISCALSDIVDQSTLLAYLSQCSRSSSSYSTEVEGEESLLAAAKDRVPSLCGPVGLPRQMADENSEVQSLVPCESKDMVTSVLEYQLEELDEFRGSMNLILAKVKDVWLLIQSRSTNEVLRILRACKEELAMFIPASLESAGALAFTLLYVRVMKLVAKIWERMVWKVQYCEMGGLEILLTKLEQRLREMRYRFIGLSPEDELHVLELILVAYMLRLSKIEICCYLNTMKKLSTTISRIEFLLKERSIEPSNFVIEVKNALHGTGTSMGGASFNPFLFTKLVNVFSLKQVNLCRAVRHLNAELDVPGNDSESPLPFVSGLPVAIPLEINLDNVLSENMLWLRITLSEESAQYIFLDLKVLQGCNEVKKFPFNAPFYRTPKASSFTLRICIGMECLSEHAYLVKGCGGPKHPLVYLCQEKEVYLCRVKRD